MSEFSNPYAAPTAPLASLLPTKRGKVALRVSAVFTVLAFAAGGLGAFGRVGFDAAGVCFFVATLCTLVGAVSACVALARSIAGPPPRAAAILGSVALLVVDGGMTLMGGLLSLLSMSGGRGRQLRRFGRVLLPALRPDDAWTRGATPLEVDPDVRDALAAQWRENARTEHASVAAFARLALDLVALGAPPELVASAHRDALDEIRHAELCLSLAAAIDGKHESPAPFPQAQRSGALPPTRVLALAKLAVDSLVDGALHEGVSARVIARLTDRAAVPRIREMLRTLAADEGRHSANGWRVVEWCIREGGRPVVQAVEGAVRQLPRRMHSTLPAAAQDGSWERWGIPGDALEAAEYANARVHVTSRVALLLRDARRAA